MKKIAIIATNNGQYSNTRLRTGLWLSELVHFYEPLKKEGYDFDIISPAGGLIPLEPKSLKWPFLDKETNQYLRDESFIKKLNDSLSADSTKPQDYCATFYTGGHGVMWDFPGSVELQNLSAQVYEAGGIVSAVCHGVCGLLNIKTSDGKHLVENKNVTGFSNAEEYFALVHKKVPYFLEDELRLRGAAYSKSIFPMLPYSVVDGRLITGQNPNSTRRVAQNLIRGLKKL